MISLLTLNPGNRPYFYVSLGHDFTFWLKRSKYISFRNVFSCKDLKPFLKRVCTARSYKIVVCFVDDWLFVFVYRTTYLCCLLFFSCCPKVSVIRQCYWEYNQSMARAHSAVVHYIVRSVHCWYCALVRTEQRRARNTNKQALSRGACTSSCWDGRMPSSPPPTQ